MDIKMLHPMIISGVTFPLKPHYYFKSNGTVMSLVLKKSTELNPSSLADIAFLMLIFFMVTTTIKEEKGLSLLLPALQTDIELPIHDRNLFTIQLNSFDEVMVEGERRSSLAGLRKEIKVFILNKGRLGFLSDSPEKAIVSFKTDRGTSHKAFIAVLDEIQGAYYEIYAEQAGVTPAEFRNLDVRDPDQLALYEKGRAGIPMGISLAEPTQVHP